MRTHTRVLLATLLAFLSVLSYAQAPVPFINLPLVPDATPPGGAQFTLTVNGTGFVPGSVVKWNGNALATEFVRSSQLTATVPAEDIATASTASVTVVAPAGNASNVTFFTVAADTGNPVGFALASSPVVGSAPVSVAAGDFNGDGKLDLAVANSDSNTVSILLGDGNGNFTLASSPDVGGYPESVAVGDFNRDGKLDLAVVNDSGYHATVSILLGDGTGNFTLASSPYVGNYPTCVAVGDFNGDGNLDLAVTNDYSNTVSVLLGDGNGNFTLTSSPDAGSNPVSVAVGDFNGDGKLDLAIVNETYQGTASILLGDGNGNFTLTSSTDAGNYSVSVAVGEFNGDGKLDLAVVGDSVSPGAGSILLGDGTGNFTLASSPNVGNYSMSVAVGDFNGDGNLDLAVADELGDTVSVLLGDGNANFTLASSAGVGSHPLSVAVGDFNGDGKLDLAVANRLSNTVSILLATPLLGTYFNYSPASLTFGTQVLGTSSAPQPVTLANIGSVPIDITKGAISANFSQTSNCPRKLPPGGTCTANVIFTPHKINTITGTMTITDNAPSSPQTVALAGVGTAVTLVPSILNFGNQQVGTTSPPQSVTFTNYASEALSIRGIGFTGAKPSYAQTNTCSTSVPAGGTCTISITFTPQSQGSKTAALEVNDNGGASPQTVSLSGTGTQ